MRTFANLFLILFCLDGSLSLLDEIVSLIDPAAFLTELRGSVAATVLLAACLLYLCLGIDRRLPKRVFLPLIAFVILCPLAGWFFPPLAGSLIFGLLSAVAQLALLTVPLSRFRRTGVHSLTMPPEVFAGPVFSLRNILTFGGVNLTVVPLVLAMYALAAVNASMAEYTAGYMRLGPGGLAMTERVFQRGDRTIRLAAMIHVGDKEYYDALAGSVARGRTIVLAEGVTDDDNLLQNRLDYDKMAGFLGLTSQETMQFPGRTIEAEDLDAPSPASEKSQSQPDILQADVDVSTFRPPTILLLDTMAKQMRESSSFLQGFRALNAWAAKNITPEMYDTIMDDILQRRNQTVIQHLGKALERYDTIVIPWGALHMKGIEEAVRKRGFVLKEERQRVSIDFGRLLRGAW
jgi:hypothetical protein